MERSRESIPDVCDRLYGGRDAPWVPESESMIETQVQGRLYPPPVHRDRVLLRSMRLLSGLTATAKGGGGGTHLRATPSESFPDYRSISKFARPRTGSDLG